MNKKVKKVLGYGLVSLMLCGPVLVSKVGAEESGSIQTTVQFKNHKDGSQSVIGKTTPNTRLRIGYDGTVETVSDGEGNYELKIPSESAFKNYERFTIYKINSDGNSRYDTDGVADTEAPSIPDFHLIAGDKVINGEANYNDRDGNATFKIILPNGDTKETSTDSEGRWEFELPDVGPGEKIKIISSDNAGNTLEKEIIASEVEAPEVEKNIQFSPNYQQLSGRTYPNSTVYVLLPDGTKLSAETGDNSYYSINIPEEHYFYKGEGKAEVWVSKNNKFESKKIEVEGFSDDESNSNSGVKELSGTLFVRNDKSQKFMGFSTTFPKNVYSLLELPDGYVIEGRTDEAGWINFNIPAEHALKNGEKGVITFKSPGGVFKNEFTAYIVPPKIGEVNNVIEGNNTIGGLVNHNITDENALNEKSKVLIIHVILPNGTERLVEPDSKGNWILSTQVLKKGDVFKVFTEDTVGNLSDSYIIKVGETPSVVKPENNNKEEQKVNSEQGTNNETEKKSESKEKGKTEVKPIEEKVTSSSQTSQKGTSKETDLNNTSSDKTLNSNSNVSKDKQTTSNSDRKENNGTVVGEKSKTGYPNNTNSGLTSSVQKVQGKQNKSLPNTGTVNHLFAMISGLVSFIVGSVIFRLKRSN
ncbi:LPXTG cell wall anchor domain-containing protein [Streptococcus sp.]|jgi:hypothetical protein|uniref:LPXTG cell wall anchor domain-containing protein n=1 Tax=Streptococcus sp. TaxID=1306 RepID=UPI0027BAEA7E|nr:LPXTG cell wall anchor domain-containing protein [Streptococcus sp.]